VELTPPPHLECRGPRKSRAIPLLNLRAFVAYKRFENLPTYCNIILNCVRQHNYFINQGNYIGYMFRL